jgi:hypothetical protein
VLIRYILKYCLGITAIVGFGGALTWLYGADAEVSAFLSENRELTTAALILSMAVYALYVRMDTDAEAVRRRQKDLRKQNDLDR